MTTANEYKKYKDLLNALAECLETNELAGSPVDSFMTGYAGAEWETAKERARWRTTAAAYRKAKEAQNKGGEASD